jgi:hypothetical protein
MCAIYTYLYILSKKNYSALASLRISQCRTEEAGVIIEGVFHRVKAIRDKVAARTVIEEMTGKFCYYFLSIYIYFFPYTHVYVFIYT